LLLASFVSSFQKVVVGVREGGASWKLAQEDGWVPGKTLFPIKTAAEKFDFLSPFLSIFWFFPSRL